jgi:hypothetical protein
MKKVIYLHFVAVILVSVLGISVQAQSRNRQQLFVNIPFAFNVGNTLLPAGDYSVSIVNPSSDRSVLKIKSSARTIMVQTNDVVGWPTIKPKLTFRRYGHEYFLAQVWMAAESTGLATRNSNAEKSLQRQLGNGNKSYDVVALNAR